MIRPGDERGALLDVSSLAVDFIGSDGKWHRVVDDVALRVKCGEIHGLVGESGSGKSVTSLAIMGLLPSTARATGSVVYDGIDLLRLGPRRLRDIQGRDVAMVFQEPMTSLNPAYRVGDQIGEGLRRHRGASRRAARQRAIELLAEVGVAEPHRRVDDYPHTFSGGMRQRVMLAIALACSPRLLVADEPTTALDVTIQANMLDLIRRLSRDHEMGVIFITHDFGVVADICDSVSVMYQGRIVERAGVHELFDHPSHPYTQRLLRAVTTVGDEGRRDRERGDRPPAAEWQDRCVYADRCEHRVDECEEREIGLRDIGRNHVVRCVRATEPTLAGS